MVLSPPKPDGDWAIRDFLRIRIFWVPTTSSESNVESMISVNGAEAGNPMSHPRKEPTNVKRSSSGYQVIVRGPLPADLVQRISALHAAAILKRLEKDTPLHPGERGPVGESDSSGLTGEAGPPN